MGTYSEHTKYSVIIIQNQCLHKLLFFKCHSSVHSMVARNKIRGRVGALIIIINT